MNKGISLLEILVAVAVFAILGVIVTQSIILTLRGSKKSESQVRARENLSYALSVIERQLRNADSITSCNAGTVAYKDSQGVSSTFSCVSGADSYVASSSARLTSNEVLINTCLFTCDLISSPPSVTISLEATEASATGIEGAQVSSSAKIYLRTY